MGNSIGTAIAQGSVVDAASSLTQQIERQLQGQTPAVALVFASAEQPLDRLMPALKERFPGTTLLGASTAGEFTEGGDRKSSTAMIAIAGEFRVHAGFATGLKQDTEAAVSRAAAPIPDHVDGYAYKTGLMLLDPLSGTSEEATLSAGALLGAHVPLAGGAAGDDLRMKSTRVALDGQVASDAVVLAAIYSKARLGVGVCHGHQPISERLKVTRAEGNVVFEIEGRPAWQVWVEHTRAAAARAGIDLDTLAPDQVGAFLLRFEAGLPSGEQYKVRAPLLRGGDDSLSFACGIPEGAQIRITESDAARQLESARLAARRAKEAMGGGPVAGAVVFDCICRNLILGSQFGDAVRSISDELGGAPLAGFETYGEIALEASDMSGFHNTTTVVLSIPR
jgi:hypothetical protein